LTSFSEAELNSAKNYDLRFWIYELRLWIDESLFWLEFISELELIPKNLLKDLIKEANELVSIFTDALKTSKIIRKS
jgi:hypothetical protein